MYKVLIVDDEKMIRMGMKKVRVFRGNIFPSAGISVCMNLFMECSRIRLR